MRKDLLSRLSIISAEEKQLLQGGSIDKKLYTHRVNGFHIDAENVISSQKLISLRSHTRFAPFPAHCHDYIEIMYVCGGSVTHVVEGGHIVCVKEGELMFLRSGTGHALQKAALSDVAINFIVKLQFFDSVFETVGSQNILWDLLFKQDTITPYLHFQVAQIKPVQNIMENLAYILLEQNNDSQRLLQQTMSLLFMHLLSHAQELCDTPNKTKRASLVANVLQEIHENYRTVLLTSLAKQYKISLPHLCNEIHKETGLTYKQLLSKRRMEKAAQLLRSTNMSVEQVIIHVGYSNTSYFYRAFNDMYGTSPKNFRKE